MHCLRCVNQDMTKQIIAQELEKIIKGETRGVGEEDYETGVCSVSLYASVLFYFFNPCLEL